MHAIKQQGQHVFKYAVRKFADQSEKILLRNDLTGTDVDLFVAHQANIRIIEAAQHRMGLPEWKVVKNIDRYGNTTAATIPLALGTALDEERLEDGRPGAPRRGRRGLHRRLGAASLVRCALDLEGASRRRRTRARPSAR